MHKLFLSRVPSAGSIPSSFYGAQVFDYPESKIMVFNDGSGGLYTNSTYDFYDLWNMQETILDFYVPRAKF